MQQSQREHPIDEVIKYRIMYAIVQTGPELKIGILSLFRIFKNYYATEPSYKHEICDRQNKRIAI
jgi:hypothetical protein